MTLYDALLLLRARWRWFLVLPALSITVTVAVLLLTPRAHVARAVVRIDPSFPGARAATLFSRWVAVEPRRGDDQVMALTGRAATSAEAGGLVSAAMASVTTTAHRETLRREDEWNDELARLIKERARFLTRRDRFVLIDYEALTKRIESRIESVRSRTPTGDILEILEPVVTIRPGALRPYPLVVSGVSALVVVFCGVFVRAWWVAERTARARMDTERAWRSRDSL